MKKLLTIVLLALATVGCVGPQKWTDPENGQTCYYLSFLTMPGGIDCPK